MKKILIALFVYLPFIAAAQSGKQKLSKDSIQYYYKQLQEIRRVTNDSMVNSEEYKEIFHKLNSNKKKYGNNFGVELNLFAGLQINNYSNLNARLSALGVKETKTALLPVGVGLAIRFNKIIVGLDMTPIMFGENSSGAAINGYLSTNSIKTKQWIFSPQIGFGRQTVNVRVPLQSTNSTFDAYFTTSANQVELRHLNSFLDFALAFKFYPKDRISYVPIFRFGYRYGLKEKAWEIRNGASTNASMDRNSNFYIQLMLGSGD